MDERLQFVPRRLAGEAMAELCREFGISRKTGYRLPDIDYPLHHKTVVVTRCGRICLGRKKLTSARSLPRRP